MDGPGLREEDGVVGGQPYPASLEGLKRLMTCPAVPTGHQLDECSACWPAMSLQASNREHKVDHVSPEAHQSAHWHTGGPASPPQDPCLSRPSAALCSLLLWPNLLIAPSTSHIRPLEGVGNLDSG